MIQFNPRRVEMRRTARRLASLAVVAILATACAGPGAATTPSPTTAPKLSRPRTL
jgi:hypothetical protein